MNEAPQDEMSEMFPIWFRVYTAVVGASYLGFALAVTHRAEPFMIGAVTTPQQMWMQVLWALSVGGGAIGAISCIVFVHAMWWRGKRWERMKTMLACDMPLPPPPEEEK